jgi:hypothetical protein
VTSNPTAVILRWGVVAMGCVLLVAVVRALRSGRTTGYYRDHVYTRQDDPLLFVLWVTGRAFLALVALCLGAFLPWH